MDSYRGKFIEMNKHDSKVIEEEKRFGINHPGIFSIGEEVELKGSKFRIKAIGTHFMRLELLPQEGKPERLA